MNMLFGMLLGAIALAFIILAYCYWPSCIDCGWESKGPASSTFIGCSVTDLGKDEAGRQRVGSGC